MYKRQGCEKTDDGLKRESTETRWNAYKSGKISREKCVEYTVKRKMKALEKDYTKALERLAAIEMGYKWKNISSGKHFDVYTIRKIEN